MAPNLLSRLSENKISLAVRVARVNWRDWRDVYEHGRDVETNPLLTCRGRFAHFCHGYRVSRTIRRGTQDQLRRKLIKQLGKAVSDDKGCALDDLHQQLRRRFGTRDGTRGFLSALSKTAAFVRPERFVARDSYSMRGLNVLLGRSAGTRFKSYAEYLQLFDNLCDARAEKELKERLREDGEFTPFEKQPQFLRRVFDICVMQCGGRILTLTNGGTNCHEKIRSRRCCANE